MSVGQRTFSVTSIATSSPEPAGAPLKIGDVVGFTLALDVSATVTPASGGATPTLALSNGASAVFTGADAEGLHFSYTVQAAQSPAQDTSALSVTGLSLNGATVTQAASLSFAAPTMFGTGITAYYVTAVDIDGDGDQDLVTSSYFGSSVTVLRNDGHGNFASQASYATATKAGAAEVADLNRDGYLDLIVPNQQGNSISVLLGNSAGGFAPQVSYTVGSHPYSVVVADVNEDGIPDLISGDFDSGTVSVLLGTGSGSFGPRATFNVGQGPIDLVARDFNGDGHLDLAVANYSNGTVSVLLGTGKGSFGPQSVYAVGSIPFTIAAGDLNGDGYLDLVTPNYGSGTVSVLMGSASGTFAAAKSFPVGANPTTALVVDVNGDGFLDIVGSNITDSNEAILLGDGKGSFSSPATFPGVRSPYSAAAADVNGDGLADLIAVDPGNQTVSVLINTSTPASTLDVSTFATATGRDTGLRVDATAPTLPRVQILGATGTDLPTDTQARIVINAAAMAGNLSLGALTSGVETTASLNGSLTFVSVNTGKTVLTLTSGVSAVSGNALGDGVFGTTIQAGSAGAAAFRQALPDGVYTLKADVSDLAGNAATSVTRRVYVDTTADQGGDAALTVSASSGGVIGGAQAAAVSFRVDGLDNDAEAVAIFTDGTHTKRVNVGANGTASVDLSGFSGTVTSSLAIRDFYGNTATVAGTSVTADTTAPAAPGVSLTRDAGVSATDRLTSDASLTVTPSEAGGSLSYMLDGVALGASPPANLAQGAHTVAVTHTDAAGNVSAATSLNFVFDSVAPVLAVSGVSGATTARGHTVSGTVNESVAGSSVTVMDGAAILGTAAVDAQGHWSLPFTYTDGGSGHAYHLTAMATDLAGNAGASGAFDFTLDFSPNRSSFGTVTSDPHSFGGQVYALYDGLLGRAPDPVGLEHWAAQFAAGVSPTVLSAAFLDSPEGQARSGAADDGAFLTQLYQATLHRAPDQIGFDHWLAELNAGTTRGAVGAGFALSPEHLGAIQPALDAGLFVGDEITSAVARIYYTVLDRAPDAIGLAHWSGLVHAGASLADQTIAFLEAPEVQGRTGAMTTAQFVDFVYQNALGRHAEQTGLDAWVYRIDHGGLNRADVTTAIGQSAEAQGHLLPFIELGWHLT